MVDRESKNKTRDDIQRKTEEFLSRGGEIKQHNRGETGEPADKPVPSQYLSAASRDRLELTSMMLSRL